MGLGASSACGGKCCGSSQRDAPEEENYLDLRQGRPAPLTGPPAVKEAKAMRALPSRAKCPPAGPRPVMPTVDAAMESQFDKLLDIASGGARFDKLLDIASGGDALEKPLPSSSASSAEAFDSRPSVARLSKSTSLVTAVFPERPGNCSLSDEAWRRIENLFCSLLEAASYSNQGVTIAALAISRDGAAKFFSRKVPVERQKSAVRFHSEDDEECRAVRFAGEDDADCQDRSQRKSVETMFEEVDVDKDDKITGQEFADFWIRVSTSGSTEEKILQQVAQIEAGQWNAVISTPPPAPVVRRKLSSRGSAEGKLNTAGTALSAEELAVTVISRPIGCALSELAWNRLKEFYFQMSCGRYHLTKKAAEEFFTCSFAKLSAEAMFNEVDVDKSGNITMLEFMNFWVQVKKSGYAESDILEEVDGLMAGGAWIDWNDNRDTMSGDRTEPKAGSAVKMLLNAMAKGTGTALFSSEGQQASAAYPKRPRWCRLSQNAWDKTEELFNLMATDPDQGVTRADAMKYFHGTFGKVSAEAMFNEVDSDGSGMISGKEFADFWVQVSKSGYKDSQVIEELDGLLKGECWVDWKDDRDPGTSPKGDARQARSARLMAKGKD